MHAHVVHEKGCLILEDSCQLYDTSKTINIFFDSYLINCGNF